MSGPGCSIRLILAAMIAIVATRTATVAAKSDFPPLTDVVITAGEASMRIRLWVTVDGEPVADRFSRNQTAYVELLFQQLDRDDDGRLNPVEAAHAPSPEIVLPGSVLASETENVNVAFNFLAVDANRDGYATSAELHEFYQYFGDGPLRVQRSNMPADMDRPLHFALWTRLDADGDGLLAPDELEGALKLASLDRDGNEVLDASELISPTGDAVNVAETGAESESFRIRTVSPSASPANLNVFVNYPASNSQGFLPEIKFQDVSGQLDLFEGDAQVLAWSNGGFSADVRVSGGPLRALDRTRRVLALEFRGADEDEDGIVRFNQRLTEFLEQTFPLLDADGDNTATIADLDYFAEELLPLESEFHGSRIALRIVEPRGGLFAVLDANHDGRLGLRELRSARDRVETLDSNEDGSIEESELRTAIQIVIERDALSIPYSVDRTPDPGPAWFTRLDRNRDGDLSPNEFLGSEEHFQNIDLDGDGLIGLSEALRMESFEREPTGPDG
jgi:Ca2+-binding EF-hand superfamily protein